MKWMLAVLLLTLGFTANADGTHSMFEAGQNCVAYKVKKKSLELFSGEVIGTNCDVSVQLLPMVGGGYQIEVSIPISSFDSGKKDRDQDVKNVLKESEQSNLLFRSKGMSEQEWHDLVKKSGFNLDGDLSIAGKSYPLTMPCQITNGKSGLEIDGFATVSFSKFDIQPPKVGGGIIAKADGNLELHFHLQAEKILGAEKVIGAPVPVASPSPDALPALPVPAPSTSPSPEPSKKPVTDPPKESELHI